jgi:hypothetical protein
MVRLIVGQTTYIQRVNTTGGLTPPAADDRFWS